MTLAKSFGFQCHSLTAREAADLFPFIEPAGVVGAAYVPSDGYVDPYGLSMAYAAGARAKGADAYVTLEPCCHFGRTGPCTEALKDAGVGRVIVAMEDPNPKVAGQGVAALRAAGVAVETGLMEDEAARLRSNELQGYRVGCAHGRLKTAERRAVMAAFKAGELDVLVATTVIEVGVDVPNATIMIVQEADRFGLAQLHQLRGRVGRGAEQSYCLLVSRPHDQLSETALERLEAMVATTDGFELAERDLEIRGEGQLVGARQSGLTDLRFTRLRADRDLLEQAKDLAAEVADDPLLADAVDRLLGEAEHVGES